MKFIDFPRNHINTVISVDGPAYTCDELGNITSKHHKKHETWEACRVELTEDEIKVVDKLQFNEAVEAVMELGDLTRRFLVIDWYALQQSDGYIKVYPREIIYLN